MTCTVTTFLSPSIHSLLSRAPFNKPQINKQDVTLPSHIWTAWNLHIEGADGFELELFVEAVLASVLSTGLTCLSKR